MRYYSILVIGSLILALAVAVTRPHAQQQSAPPEVQYLIQAIEGQRNMALTMHAQAEARASALAQENAKLKTELEKLKEREPAYPFPTEPAK
jgi:hypothetical protein